MTCHHSPFMHLPSFLHPLQRSIRQNLAVQNSIPRVKCKNLRHLSCESHSKVSEAAADSSNHPSRKNRCAPLIQVYLNVLSIVAIVVIVNFSLVLVAVALVANAANAAAGNTNTADAAGTSVRTGDYSKCYLKYQICSCFRLSAPLTMTDKLIFTTSFFL
jgi:hypothetical protein